MASQRFDIDNNLWAERDGNLVRFHRQVPTTDLQHGDEVMLELGVDTLRNLLVWADQERGVTASLTGPMAAQIREAAKELGLTPEMFIWHAVKVFIEVGTS